MANKAYIVANEQQEREVLNDLENQGYTWDNLVRSKPTLHVHKLFDGCEGFPYALFANENNHRIRWDKVELSNGLEIVYDGRKEGKMKISKEVYDALVEWKDEHETELEAILTKLIDPHEVTYLATIVDDWWLDSNISNIESNNRLIAIIRWANGEDVFEVKSKKWVVGSKSHDAQYNGVYVKIEGENYIKYPAPCEIKEATRFDTKEEAESWANSHQEVVQVEVEI